MPPLPPHEPDETRHDGRFRRSRPVDHRIADILDDEDRVIEREMLLEVGLSEDQIYKRVRRGSLHRKQRGVYTAGNARVELHGEWRAAVAAVGDDAFLDAGTACALWGARRAETAERIHVVCRRDVRDRGGVRVHWQPDLPEEDTSLRHGVRVVTPARALLGYAAATKDEARVRRVLGQMLVDQRVSVPAIVELLARSKGRRGAARLARLLGTATPTRSELEDMAAVAMRTHGLAFATNARVAGWEVDVLFAEARLVVEIDSRYHDTAVARANDARKDIALVAAGYEVLRVRKRDLTVDLHRFLAQVDERTRRNQP